MEMKNKRNTLFGRGETLITPITLKSTGGKKKHPYSPSAAKVRFSKKIINFNSIIKGQARDKKPNGEVVSLMTLHPSYMAKSHYPEKLFKEFDLATVGSISKKVKPEKIVGKEKELFTIAYYVSGKEESFNQLSQRIEEIVSDDDPIVNDIRKFEDISIPEDKIIDIDDLSQPYIECEVTLHLSDNSNSILSDFIIFLRKNDAAILEHNIIKTKKLAFIPVTIQHDKLKDISDYNFVRVIKRIPEINDYIKTNVNIRNDKVLNLSLPNNTISDEPIAIFDSGLNDNFLNPLVKYVDLTSGGLDGFEEHGRRVTSAALFGPINNTSQIPTPYAPIHHYRVINNNERNDPATMYNVLNRIVQVIKNNNYRYVNLSVGPNISFDINHPDPWTTTLDDLFSDGKTIVTVAAGNTGDDHDINKSKIQPPADMINAISVGACDRQGTTWQRSCYSAKGPGRSPGLIKPDILAFGGDYINEILLLCPFTSDILSDYGTSFAAPSVLRLCAGIESTLDYQFNPSTLKALLVNNSDIHKDSIQDDVGWGKLPDDLLDIITCQENEARVVYESEVEPGKSVRAFIPMPFNLPSGKYKIKSTIVFFSKTEPENPINYTQSGLVCYFRPNLEKKADGSIHAKTKGFFTPSNMYNSEGMLRSDNHKWETCLKAETSCYLSSLDTPHFDIHYHTREGGHSSKNKEKLMFSLIVSIEGKKGTNIYNLVKQQYKTLSTIEVRQDVINLIES